MRRLQGLVWKEGQRSTANRTHGDKHRDGRHTPGHTVRDERNQNSSPDPFHPQVFAAVRYATDAVQMFKRNAERAGAGDQARRAKASDC